MEDVYGFELDNISAKDLEDLEREREIQNSKDLEVWISYNRQNKLPGEAKLKELIRRGVPPTLRPWVWMERSGANAKKNSVGSNYFQNMVKAGATSRLRDEIQQVTAVNEENTFWLVAALVENILHPGTYAANLEGAQVEMKVLEELLSTKMPGLQQHLSELDVDMSILATDWFLALFSTSMPSETVAHIWDTLFNEGPKIIFRVALALFKIKESALMKADNAGDIVLLLRQTTAAMYKHEQLMGVAFDGLGSLSMATIDQSRQARTVEVKRAIHQRQVLQRRQDLKESVNAAQDRKEDDEIGDLEEDAEALQNMKIKDELKEAANRAAAGVKDLSAKTAVGFGKLVGQIKEISNKTAVQLSKKPTSSETIPAHPPPPYSKDS